MITAEAAAILTEEKRPHYVEQKVKDILIKVDELIKKATDKSNESFSGNWELDFIGHYNIRKTLEDMGYYVYYNFDGGLLSVCVAWGKYGQERKDFEKNKQKEVRKSINKKWWQ